MGTSRCVEVRWKRTRCLSLPSHRSRRKEQDLLILPEFIVTPRRVSPPRIEAGEAREQETVFENGASERRGLPLDELSVFFAARVNSATPAPQSLDQLSFPPR